MVRAPSHFFPKSEIPFVPRHLTDEGRRNRAHIGAKGTQHEHLLASPLSSATALRPWVWSLRA